MVTCKELNLSPSPLTSYLTFTVRLGNSGLKVSRIILGSLSHFQDNIYSTNVLIGEIPFQDA